MKALILKERIKIIIAGMLIIAAYTVLEMIEQGRF